MIKGSSLVGISCATGVAVAVGVATYLRAQPAPASKVPQGAMTSDAAFSASRQSKQTAAPPIVSKTLAPTIEELRREWDTLSAGKTLSPLLAGKRYRVLKLHTHVDDAALKAASQAPSFYDAYRALVFIYSDNRAIDVYAKVGSSEPTSVVTTNDKPDAVGAEFAEAAELVKRNPRVAAALAKGEAELYTAMPGLVTDFAERTVLIGLSPLNNSAVVPAWIPVNLVRRQIAYLPTGSPKAQSASALGPQASRVQFADAASLDIAQLSVVAAATGCNPPDRHDDALNSDVDGAQMLSVTWANWAVEVWRPYSSQPQSGAHDFSATDGKGGGVELRFVAYKGKRFLFRAHVPVLTAKYPNPGSAQCGPYRDWLFEESKFTAQNPGSTNGIALNVFAQSILETGTDVGNFKGVAIWTQWDSAAGQNKMVVLSELQAGWYRYVHKWTFFDGGQMVPEFGFEGTFNACTCNPHVHHPYWRFDFDIVDAGNDRIWDYFNAVYKTSEFSTTRRLARSSNLLAAVQDSVTLDWVNIWAGWNDGTAANATLSQGGFAVNDWWGLAYHMTELYDGVGPVQGSDSAIKPQINNFVNGETINSTDVVVWYGAHFLHDPSQSIPSHYVGPTLIPSW